jgi:hypothetical protein
MNYVSTKDFWKNLPETGNALLLRTTSHFRRSVNGAWLGNGSESEVFEIPVAELNSEGGVGWLTPGRCSQVSVRFDDGAYMGIDPSNDPVRGEGFGALGYVTIAGRKELISLPNSHLPNCAKGYYRVVLVSDEVLKTFEPVGTEAAPAD